MRGLHPPRRFSLAGARLLRQRGREVELLVTGASDDAMALASPETIDTEAPSLSLVTTPTPDAGPVRARSGGRKERGVSGATRIQVKGTARPVSLVGSNVGHAGMLGDWPIRYAAMAVCRAVLGRRPAQWQGLLAPAIGHELSTGR
jgi:hypothetical protein